MTTETIIRSFLFQQQDGKPDLMWEGWQALYPKPSQLYVQGLPESFRLLDRLPHQGLAIVGSRKPQERSKQFTVNFVRGLKQSGLIILSGLASGIDAVAHETALEVELPTIAVIATGLNRQYPPENLQLKERILAEGGLVVSEYPLDTHAKPAYFLARNRIIAGWSLATCVIEAGFRSGALNTARWAREINRNCYAVPCFPQDPPLAGNQILLDRDHAEPLWNIHSLGSTWLPLATQGSSRQA